MSVNKVILIGNVGADPELKFVKQQTAICEISLATSETFKDKQTSEKKNNTEWHRVVFFDKLAEISGEYLKKGSQVYIEGKIKTEKYTKDGIERYSTKIIADTMRILSTKQNDGALKSQPLASSSFNDKEIPF